MIVNSIIKNSFFIIILTSCFLGCSIVDDYINKVEYNEKLAIASIRNIIIQQLYFKESKGTFVSWEEIRTPPKYQGYVFEMKSDKEYFQIWAVPQMYGSSGKISYYFDSKSRKIRGEDLKGQKASVNSPIIETIKNKMFEDRI